MDGSAETKRAQIPVRTTPANRARLTAAAKAAGRSLTQEIEQRIENSFSTEDREGGPATHSLLNMLATEIALVESYAGKSWAEDVSTWSAVRTRVRAKFDDIRPPFVNSEKIAELSQKLSTLKTRATVFLDYLTEIGAIKAHDAPPSLLADILAQFTHPAIPLPILKDAPRKVVSIEPASEPEKVFYNALNEDQRDLQFALRARGYELAIDLNDRSSWNLTTLKGAPMPASEYAGIDATFALFRKFAEEELEVGKEFMAAFAADDAAIKDGERMAQSIAANREALKMREEQG